MFLRVLELGSISSSARLPTSPSTVCWPRPCAVSS